VFKNDFSNQEHMLLGAKTPCRASMLLFAPNKRLPKRSDPMELPCMQWTKRSSVGELKNTWLHNIKSIIWYNGIILLLINECKFHKGT
jgi:hypothetical protein